MAHDLAATPATGIMVQACGDAHVANFGVFATPERHLIFDVTDFDETLPGPWEWDVKRLATSAVVAGHERGSASRPAWPPPRPASAVPQGDARPRRVHRARRLVLPRRRAHDAGAAPRPLPRPARAALHARPPPDLGDRAAGTHRADQVRLVAHRRPPPLVGHGRHRRASPPASGATARTRRRQATPPDHPSSPAGRPRSARASEAESGGRPRPPRSARPLAVSREEAAARRLAGRPGGLAGPPSSASPSPATARPPPPPHTPRAPGQTRPPAAGHHTQPRPLTAEPRRRPTAPAAAARAPARLRLLVIPQGRGLRPGGHALRRGVRRPDRPRPRHARRGRAPRPDPRPS